MRSAWLPAAPDRRARGARWRTPPGNTARVCPPIRTRWGAGVCRTLRPSPVRVRARSIPNRGQAVFPPRPSTSKSWTDDRVVSPPATCLERNDRGEIGSGRFTQGRYPRRCALPPSPPGTLTVMAPDDVAEEKVCPLEVDSLQFRHASARAALDAGMRCTGAGHHRYWKALKPWVWLP